MQMPVGAVINTLQNYYKDPNETIVVTWWDYTDVAGNTPIPDELNDAQRKMLWDKTAQSLSDILESEFSAINTIWAAELNYQIENGVLDDKPSN